jgi:cytochrome P450
LFSLTRPINIVENRGTDTFEPAHPAYYDAPPGRAIRLMLQARQDFLSIWRHSDYQDQVSVWKALTREVLIVNSPAAIEYALVERKENFERKTPQMRRALEYLLGDGLFISDGDTWSQRRPLVGDIVHKSRVPAFGHIMRDATVELADRWAQQATGTPVNMLYAMAELTAEIIARSVFGSQLGSDACKVVTEGFTGYQSAVDSVNPGYFLGADNGCPIFKTPRIKRSVASIHQVVDKIIEAHIAGQGENNSMVDLLIQRQRKSPDLKLDLVALRNEAATIFMAGHETTAATLTWAWYLIANAPWVEQALLDEIESVCGSRIPTVDDVPNLPWARAIVEETLRLYPPVPILGRQAREADEIAGIPVKPASLVLIVPWLLHRTAEFFPEPHLFRPERFIEGKPRPYSYLPFAIGPRVCPGLQFGRVEAILCLAILAQRFKVRVASGFKVKPLCRLTLRPDGGLPVVITPR